ncbi:MgtC/SapB family protein [Companilactobacillus sp. HBUAS56275]|uniref:MgtC/SapB family protein n=1 Tax=Candidatus Companilactobacillus pullicola TaxID=2838523 RepID=A0A9D1ZPS7_9LACO|nr:MgtC/SapB family protein [Candidatus Companilactobacillus pullicola]
MTTLNTAEIVLRLVSATFFAGLIGYDREQKNHPAGIRTHILVCVGACLIALIQQEISLQVINTAQVLPKINGVIRADPARLIAQVVSGIGFLGAGTIVITRHSVTGLTTAASLWATAGIGLAIGMGYYQIALISVVIVLLVLVILKRVLKVHTYKKIEIKYKQRNETNSMLQSYFDTNHIRIANCSLRTDTLETNPIYTNIYTVDLPRSLTYPKVMYQLSKNDNILQIRLITV